jgi:hypothetical protein
MRCPVRGVDRVVLLLTFPILAAQEKQAKVPDVTFYRDVAPIV